MGQVTRIWIKGKKGGPMDVRQSAELVKGQGLVGNANQGGKRQVTLMEREVWVSLMERLGSGLDPSVRRANILVDDFPLAETRGRTLRIGACRLLVHGETKPCDLMEESLAGLREAMAANWGGGAFAEVLDSGVVSVGDPVEWVEGG